MSETVVLVFPDAEVDVTWVASLLAGTVEVFGGDSNLRTVRDGSRMAFLVRVPDAEADTVFDEDWSEHLVPRKPFSMFALDYQLRNAAFVVHIVHVLAAQCGLVVDTNFGRVLEGKDLALADLAIPSDRGLL